MKILQQKHKFLTPGYPEKGKEALQLIEIAARTCYKSEDRITDDSATQMCAALIRRGHEAMLEHASFSVRFTTDRGIANEIVRHRAGTSFAQVSTRYVNYSKGKFGKEISVIEPFERSKNPKAYAEWYAITTLAENAYMNMLHYGATPEEARDVLPLSLATELVVTTNIREWRHILKLRTAPDAHPKIRALMIPLLDELKANIPVLFDDINPKGD